MFRGVGDTHRYRFRNSYVPVMIRELLSIRGLRAIVIEHDKL